MKARVAILTNNIAPYRHDLFDKVAKRLVAAGGRFKVFFMRDRESDRDWEILADEMTYSSQVLAGFHLRLKGSKEIHFNPRLLWALVKESPDVVIIGGYNSVTSWLALSYCKLFGRKVVLWSGSTLPSSRHRGGYVGLLRRVFVGACDAHITYGTQAATFVKSFGAAPDGVFVGCNVGDTHFFRCRNDEQWDRGAQAGPRLIFVGRLVLEKGVKNLLEALGQLRDLQWSLDVVGDGPWRKGAEQLIETMGLGRRIRMRGFQQKAELRNLYRRADIFVHPTLLDRFSIVMSEALANGLFVIASKYDGASADIVVPGENGVVTDPADVSALASAMRQVISMWPALPSRQRISSTVDGCQDKYAQQFVDSISFVLTPGGGVR